MSLSFCYEGLRFDVEQYRCIHLHNICYNNNKFADSFSGATYKIKIAPGYIIHLERANAAGFLNAKSE